MDQGDIDWNLTTWEGSRREQLRRWRMLSVRERLQAIEEMAELARALAGANARPQAVDRRSSGDPE